MIKECIKTFRCEFKKDGMIYILIFVIPFLVNIIIGYEFSAGVISNIPMAVVDYDNSYLSRMIITEFRNNEDFKIEYNVNSADELKELIDNSKVRVGMIIPPDFNMNVMKLNSPNILMLYDGSHMSITSVAKSMASEILLSIKAGISMNFIKAKLGVNEEIAKNIALGINFNNRVLYNPTKSFNNFLNPGFSTAIVQTGLALMTAVAIRRKELDKGFQSTIGYYLGKLIFYSSMGFVSILSSIIIQNKIFNIPFKSNYYDAAVLSLLFVLAVTSVCLIISSLFKDRIFATIISAVIFVPNTIMIGYTWPVISMPAIYQYAAKVYPFYYYADNLRDLFLKGINLSDIKSSVLNLINISVLSIVIGIIILLIVNRKTNINTSEEEQNAIVSGN